MSFQGVESGAIPGNRAIIENKVSNIFWGSWEVNKSFVIGGIVLSTAVDSSNTPTTTLRPGLTLQAGTDGSWRPTGIDVAGAVEAGTVGTGEGILLYETDMLESGVAVARMCLIAVGGAQIKASGLTEAADADYGIANLTNGAALRTNLVSEGFKFDDAAYQ